MCEQYIEPRSAPGSYLVVVVHTLCVDDVQRLDGGGRGDARVADGWGEAHVGATVDDEQRVGGLDDLLVDGDAVEVLLEHHAQRLVLLDESVLFLVERELVQQDLVVALPELVERVVLAHGYAVVRER